MCSVYFEVNSDWIVTAQVGFRFQKIGSKIGSKMSVPRLRGLFYGASGTLSGSVSGASFRTAQKTPKILTASTNLWKSTGFTT